MPEIHPFRALRYAARDVTSRVTQPYDRIDDRLQREYYMRDPFSFIRVDRPMGTHGDAASTLRAWRRDGVMVRDSAPALYAYHQVHGGRVRKGLTAVVRLGDRTYGHEETHSGPKVDRLRMLRATQAHISHVFLLYSDPERTVNRLLDGCTRGAPILEARDDYGELHRVWRVDDPRVVGAIRDFVAARDAIIADGHHRYETAVSYRDEMRAAGRACEGAESFENVLATLVNMDDDLTIYGTHRVISGLDRVDLARLGEFFDVRETSDVQAALAAETERPVFGLIRPGLPPQLLVVRDVRAAAAKVAAPRSEEWRSLDVNILHTVILEGMLGITLEHTTREMYVEYLRSADEAVERVRSGRAQAAFLVNPVRIGQIRRLVASGEKFPQKSTDFYPKLLSGLLLCPLELKP